MRREPKDQRKRQAFAEDWRELGRGSVVGNQGRRAGNVDGIVKSVARSCAWSRSRCEVMRREEWRGECGSQAEEAEEDAVLQPSSPCLYTRSGPTNSHAPSHSTRTDHVVRCYVRRPRPRTPRPRVHCTHHLNVSTTAESEDTTFGVRCDLLNQNGGLMVA